MTGARPRGLIATLAVVGLGCQAAPRSPSRPAEAPVVQPTPATPATSAQAPNPAALARPTRVVVVGGCLLDCAAPEQSLEAFLRATLDGERAAIQRHLDTSRLIDRGRHLGDRWAAMWESGDLALRSAEIDGFLDVWATLSTSWIDPGDRTRDPKFTIDKNEGRELTATWWVPEQATGAPPALPRTLQLTLCRRGLEWLVCRIDD